MPLFEYKCRQCDKEFELIKSASEKDEVTCPSCGGVSDKQLSVIAKPSSGSSAASSLDNAPKGGCGSGSCGFGGCGF